ncbi:hypothetical protein OG552_04975 [Streptomyces sp. NBC_01476]|uniref:hypothetical protein n=1 Tax=Streptomyces sp. NBC_01476 TaxID=2903881 RepID=UPI002E35F995|nr:hypothetical protein [Streptomyces sp. NBC_01476]
MAAANERNEPGREARGPDRAAGPRAAADSGVEPPERKGTDTGEAMPGGTGRARAGGPGTPAAGRPAPDRAGQPEEGGPASGQTCSVPRRAGDASRSAGLAPEKETAARESDGEPRGERRRRSLHWPHRRRKDGPGAAVTEVAEERTYGRNGQRVPTGLGASLTTSGGMLLAMVEDVRMRGSVAPEQVRPLADAFARHLAAKEATVRKVLIRHDIATKVVERDRQEGELIQGILDRALMGRHPEETRMLTVDGALTQMYQYLSHERRDLVPAIDTALSREDSESLAAAFEAISDPAA